MRTVLVVAYVAMAAWLLLAAVIRVVLLLHAGNGLDPLPFVSGALAGVALLGVLPMGVAHLRRSRAQRRADARRNELVPLGDDHRWL
jgi:drug/metabolite transporter (DMT)-like permease